MQNVTEYRYFRHVLFFLISMALLALDSPTGVQFVENLTLIHIPEPVQVILRGIGEAIIIAIVLVVVFDEAAKRQFLAGVITLQRYLMRFLVKAPFPVREIGTVLTLLHVCHVP